MAFLPWVMLFTMVCLGNLVGTLVLWYIPKQYNTFVRNLLCCTKNALKFDCPYNRLRQENKRRHKYKINNANTKMKFTKHL